jgi:tripartite-type tricarboxylate transporter receptor subunit TctC
VSSTAQLVLSAVASALSPFAFNPSVLAQSYPTQTVKLVVPAPPGGPVDLYGRVAARIIQQSLGAMVIVENRPGAGGATGVRSVANASPDGHTLLVGNNTTLGVLPATSADPGFDPLSSFTPVAMLANSATTLVVAPSFPGRAVADVVSAAKSQPGKLNYASVGIATLPHLQTEVFKSRTGTDIVHVPFKNGPEMVGAVLGGHVQMAFAEVSVVIPLVRDGKLKALGISSPQRHPQLPDVPTMIESGIADFVFPMWTGVVAPASTPAPIVERLHTALQDGLRSPEIVDLLAKSGALPALGTSGDFRKLIVQDLAKWSAVAKQAGFAPKR